MRVLIGRDLSDLVLLRGYKADLVFSTLKMVYLVSADCDAFAFKDAGDRDSFALEYGGLVAGVSPSRFESLDSVEVYASTASIEKFVEWRRSLAEVIVSCSAKIHIEVSGRTLKELLESASTADAGDADSGGVRGFMPFSV